MLNITLWYDHFLWLPRSLLLSYFVVSLPPHLLHLSQLGVALGR